MAPYGQPVDSEICDKVNKYIDLLMYWNSKIALTGVIDPSEILRFHFGESIFAIKFANIRRGRLADVGSGAGFPGLAIKIFRPELNIVLIEPNHKKSAFLAEVTRSLGLSSVEIMTQPFEESGIPIDSLQHVTCRALAKVPQLLSWSYRCLSQGGSVILWVSREKEAEVQKSNRFAWSATELIPGTRSRSILVGQKK